MNVNSQYFHNITPITKSTNLYINISNIKTKSPIDIIDINDFEKMSKNTEPHDNLKKLNRRRLLEKESNIKKNKNNNNR